MFIYLSSYDYIIKYDENFVKYFLIGHKTFTNKIKKSVDTKILKCYTVTIEEDIF